MENLWVRTKKKENAEKKIQEPNPRWNVMVFIFFESQRIYSEMSAEGRGEGQVSCGQQMKSVTAKRISSEISNRRYIFRLKFLRWKNHSCADGRKTRGNSKKNALSAPKHARTPSQRWATAWRKEKHSFLLVFQVFASLTMCSTRSQHEITSHREELEW